MTGEDSVSFCSVVVNFLLFAGSVALLGEWFWRRGCESSSRRLFIWMSLLWTTVDNEGSIHSSVSRDAFWLLMRLVPLSSDSYNEDMLCLIKPTRVTSNYDNPSLPWVTFMPILWNTTERDQFQKYTKESISWPFVGKWASLMHRSCLTLQCIHMCGCDGPKPGADNLCLDTTINLIYLYRCRSNSVR